MPQDVTYGAAISALDMSKHAIAKLLILELVYLYIYSYAHQTLNPKPLNPKTHKCMKR